MKQKIIPYKPYLKEIARRLRKNMTLSEVLLWNELRRKQMLAYDFARQKPLDTYIVDFYCKQLCLAIEIDGSSHSDEQVYQNDQIRQQRLESLGISFLRFSDSEVKQDMTNVLFAIESWILNYEEKKE